MSRNYVSKLFVGAGVANVATGTVKDPATLTEGQIIAVDFAKIHEADAAITAATTEIAFIRNFPTGNVVAGPIPVSGIISANENPYEAPRAKSTSLTVTAPPAEALGKAVIIKVIYHDNLSIIPNQIKQTAIAPVFEGEDDAAWAAKIAADFTRQQEGGYIFVDVVAVGAVVTFTGKVISTQSNYNGIDRPEAVNFEIGAPEGVDGLGTYTKAVVATLRHGQGDASKIAWLEEQHMGRLGYADRRRWDNTKKYQSQLLAGVSQYNTLVINANEAVEGDMQGVRFNPVGVVICASDATMTVLKTDLAVAGIVPADISASGGVNP